MATAKFAPVITMMLVLLAGAAQPAAIVHHHQPSTPLGIPHHDPKTSVVSELNSLCSEPMKTAMRLDWDKVLGAWFLEASTIADSSGTRCVAQTFDEVDTDYGIIEKTMFVLREEETAENGGHSLPTLLKTVGVFDPLDPNTIISIFRGEDGSKVPVETIILDTDYLTYAIGYECSGRSSEGMTFEHMAILTRSASPLSAAERLRLVRRALAIVPPGQRGQHKFHRASKDGCEELLRDKTGANDADGAPAQSFAQVLESHNAVINPGVFNRAH